MTDACITELSIYHYIYNIICYARSFSMYRYIISKCLRAFFFRIFVGLDVRGRLYECTRCIKLHHGYIFYAIIIHKFEDESVLYCVGGK